MPWIQVDDGDGGYGMVWEDDSAARKAAIDPNSLAGKAAAYKGGFDLTSGWGMTPGTMDQAQMANGIMGTNYLNDGRMYWGDENAPTAEQSVITEEGYRVPVGFAQQHGLKILGPAPADIDRTTGFDKFMETVGDMAPAIMLGFALGPAGLNLSRLLGGGLAGNMGAGALSSLLTGGDPLLGAVTGGAKGLFGGAEAFGAVEAADDMAAGAAMLAESGQSYGQFLASLTEGGSAIDSLVAGFNDGIASKPGQMLLADAGTTTDVPVLDTAAEQVAGVSSGINADDWLATQNADDMARGAEWAQNMATGTTAPSGNWLSDLAKTANEHKTLVGAGLTLGGGLISGVMAGQRQDDLIQANKEAMTQRTQEQVALDQSKRDAIQKGSYFDANLKFKPGSKVLRRPDGSMVYATPGLIAGAMGAK